MGDQKVFTENSAFRSPEVRNYQYGRQFEMGHYHNIGDFDGNPLH
jgi:hypothetical protein